MINSKISIVKLGPDEWQKYKRIRLETLKAEPKAFNSTYDESLTYPSVYWKEKLGNNNNLFAFAKDNKKIIGIMNLTIGEEGETDETAVIHGAYVNQNYRGQGVGKSLLNYLLEEVKKNDEIKLLKLWVKDTQITAKRLYESMGFEFTVKAGEHTSIMEKRLK
ncbi:GNAT family N-acetyltransferase [Candidatus Shapirobacteria bacterium]|nr:GNAT family N-acetyltransferase [Candidatus Shapirobacteria bacterium]